MSSAPPDTSHAQRSGSIVKPPVTGGFPVFQPIRSVRDAFRAH
jgi:hypothetical protein